MDGVRISPIWTLRLGAVAVIPPKSNRQLQREYDKELYKQGNLIERCFSKLKQFRGFAPRYEKTRRTSRPSSPSLAPGCTFSYLSIKPRPFPVLLWPYRGGYVGLFLRKRPAERVPSVYTYTGSAPVVQRPDARSGCPYIPGQLTSDDCAESGGRPLRAVVLQDAAALY
jgi:hypothetical protein